MARQFMSQWDRQKISFWSLILVPIWKKKIFSPWRPEKKKNLSSFFFFSFRATSASEGCRPFDYSWWNRGIGVLQKTFFIPFCFLFFRSILFLSVSLVFLNTGTSVVSMTSTEAYRSRLPRFVLGFSGLDKEIVSKRWLLSFRILLHGKHNVKTRTTWLAPV